MFPKIFLPAALIVYYDTSKENVNKSFVLRNLLIISLKNLCQKKCCFDYCADSFLSNWKSGKTQKIPKNAVTAFTNLMSGTEIFLQFVGKIHFLSPVIPSPRQRTTIKTVNKIKFGCRCFWNRLQSLTKIDKASTSYTERRTKDIEGMAERISKTAMKARSSLLYACFLDLVCRACLHSFFIDCQSARELRITSIPRDAVI